MATSSKTSSDGSLSRSAGLKFMIMNTGGKNTGEKPADRRKQAVFDVIADTKAALVLLQEFSWTGIRSRGWTDFIWPDNLEYVGHKHASIIFDINEVLIEQVSQNTLDGVLRELVRLGRIQQGFAPIPRLCVRKVKTKGVPNVKFLCISWHGRHNKVKYDDLKDEFRYLMEFIVKLSESEKLPLVIAGDFNVKLKDVQQFVPSSLVLYNYSPTKRREESVIDFYICSSSFILKNIRALKLESKTGVDDVLSLFDHDPVEASLTTLSSLSKPKAKTKPKPKSQK